MEQREKSLVAAGAIITGIMMATISIGSFAISSLITKNIQLNEDIEVLQADLSMEQATVRSLRKNIEGLKTDILVLKTDVAEKEAEIKGLNEIEKDLSEQMFVLVDDISLREKEIKSFKQKIKENAKNEKYLKKIIAQKEQALERVNDKYKKKELEYQKIIGAKEQAEVALISTAQDNIDLQWKQLRLSVQMEACSQVLKGQRQKCIEAFDVALRDSKKRRRFENCSRQKDTPFWGRIENGREPNTSGHWQQIGDDQYTRGYYIDFCDDSLVDNKL